MPRATFVLDEFASKPPEHLNSFIMSTIDTMPTLESYRKLPFVLLQDGKRKHITLNATFKLQ